jgi:hypothetical protein
VQRSTAPCLRSLEYAGAPAQMCGLFKTC